MSTVRQETTAMSYQGVLVSLEKERAIAKDGDKEFPKEKQDINSATEDTTGTSMLTTINPLNANIPCRNPVQIVDGLLPPQCDEKNSQEKNYGLKTPVTPDVQQVGDRVMTVVTAKTNLGNYVDPSKADGSTNNNDVRGAYREKVQENSRVWVGDAMHVEKDKRDEEENKKPQEEKEERSEKQGGLAEEQNTCPNLVNNHPCEKSGYQDKSEREQSENTGNEQTVNKKAAQRKKRKYKQEISTNSSQDESGEGADAGALDKKSPEDTEEELAEDTSASLSCNAAPSGTRYASTVAKVRSLCSTPEVSDNNATRFKDFINDKPTSYATQKPCSPPSFIHPQREPEQETKRSPVAGAASQGAGEQQCGGINQGNGEGLLAVLKSEEFKSKNGTIGVLINKNLICKNGKYQELSKDGSRGHFYATQLSSGGFGRVSYCWDSSTRQDFVIKKIHQERFSINEVLILLQAHYKHILKLFGVIKRESMVELLLEYASGGTWVNLKYPRGVVGPVSLLEEVIFCHLKQALEGLYYLHYRGWWHCDIKPSNIGKTDDGIVKIIDFGGAMKRDSKPGKGMTLNYLPPEVCTDMQNCSEKMDIWALACSVIFLMTGKEVWTYLPKRIEAVTNGPLPEDQENLQKLIATYGSHIVEYAEDTKDKLYTYRLKNLICYMLNPVPGKRWSALDCLNEIQKLTPTTVTVSVPSVLPDIQQLLQDQTEPAAQCEDSTSGYQTQPPRRKGDLREIETRERNGEEQNREEEELGSQEEFYPGHIPIDM